MKIPRSRILSSSALACVLTLAALASAHGQDNDYEQQNPNAYWWSAGHGDLAFGADDYVNSDGALGFVTSAPVKPAGHPFFDALGSNGRGCVTCHQPSQSMSVATGNIQYRWQVTGGADPIFAAIDGSNCPSLPQAQEASHSLVLDRGLFRIALAWPPRDATGKIIVPDFSIAVVQDPTGCNHGRLYGLDAPNPSISVYRRPRMIANFPPLGGCGGGAEPFAIMADGRAPNLAAQAREAALTHLQMKAAPSDAQLQAIVALECELFAAQSVDRTGTKVAQAGNPPGLGPENLRLAVSSYLKTPPGDNAVFKNFDKWGAVGWSNPVDEISLRASVARGADIFSHHTFKITGAMGVNSSGQAVNGTCATCHDVAMTGRSSARWIDTGSTNLPWANPAPALPLFKITCNGAPHPFLGREFYTQDPGRALVTGKCADVGAIVVQQLRGLAARAPYFTNGSAQSLWDVVDFYDRRFDAHYTPQEKQDLVNFLGVL